ncbi:PQQ-binding-like beta-propeller repeat protein [Methylocystis sp.]|uniref:outer membrane protein assembly factor BamB family protein n=1 Tax=Methylocystis sp. TaxID=1911079 RepID=UPI003D133C05
MKKATKIAIGVAAAVGAAAAGAIYMNWNAFVPIAAMGINYVRYLNAPKGELTVETAQDLDHANMANGARPLPPDDGLWPSYNKTLASDRFSSLNEIDRENVSRLKVLCTYDTGQYTGFNSGLVMVDGAVLFATEFDTFSIDPLTCRENWRKHENYAPATPQGVNRGVAYLDGRVFRGLQDGRVLAYDFKTGERLWETAIADPKKSESAPAAPIAWNGLVFIGNAGGDFKGVKGRMYALDAATGRIVWEFYLVPKQPGDPTRGPEGATPLNTSSWNQAPGSPISGGATWTSYTLDPQTGLLYVPGGNPAPDFAAALRGGENLFSDSVVVLDAKTGAYHTHFKIVGKDWHDWDVSSAPALVTTASGRRMMLVAPNITVANFYEL